MNSLRVRLLVALMLLLAVAAAVMGAVTYRNVRAETESIFDYQYEDFEFVDYQHHETIKAPVAV